MVRPTRRRWLYLGVLVANAVGAVALVLAIVTKSSVLTVVGLLTLTAAFGVRLSLLAAMPRRTSGQRRSTAA